MRHHFKSLIFFFIGKGLHCNPVVVYCQCSILLEYMSLSPKPKGLLAYGQEGSPVPIDALFNTG